MLVPLRRWLSVPHMSRRGAELSLLIALAVLLQLAAGVGLAYVAGFSQVSAALGNIRWVWLFALVGALFVSFAGYYFAYQGIFRVEEGPTLSRRYMRAVVVAGFGGFFAHGRGALDQYALEAAGASRRDAQVRATALAGLEHGVLAIGVCGAAIAVLASGVVQPPADTTVPWAIIPVPGFLVAFWAAGRYQARFRDHAGWRGALAAFLDSVYLIRVLFLRPYRWASALLGMALFWAAEAFAAWAALAALGVEMSVAALIVGFGTGMVFTRRTGPLGGAGVLVLVLPPALWYSGAPLAAAVVGVFIYQVLFLWLPIPVALTLLPTLRAMGEQREPLAVHHEAGVTDYGRRQAHRPSRPAPVAAPHRALSSAGFRLPGGSSHAGRVFVGKLRVGERFAYNLGSHLMAKHDVDPMLQQLVRAVNESGQAAVPVTVSVHGAVLTGALIAQSRYFSELVEGNPLMNALEPGSGLLGKEYAKEVEAESDHHLHVRAAGIRRDGEAAEGPWRISLEAVDGWALRATAGTDVKDDRGPFARLLGTP